MFDASPPLGEPPDPPPERTARSHLRRPPATPARAGLHAELDRLLDARAGDGGPALAAAIVAYDQVQRAVDGALVAVLSGFDASMEWAADGHRSPISWIAANTGLSAKAAGSMRRTSLDGADRPHLAGAAAEGRLPLGHIRLVGDARRAPVEDLFDRDEAELVATACELTADGLRVHLARWRYDALAEAQCNEPDGPEPPASAGNVLRLSSLLDGRAKLDAELDPQGAASVRSGLDRELDRLRASGALEADPRTLREIEGDLFVAIFERGMAQRDGAAPAPLVVATVDLDTLLGRAGFDPPDERTARRAEIVGHGPVSDDVMAELISRASLGLLVTDPATGHPLWYGRRRRMASAAQRQAVAITSLGHCDFPGCTVAVHRCQVDHLRGWEDGGGTDISNLRPLCRFHNPLKHRRQIQAVVGSDGTTSYTSRDGTPITSRYRHDP